MLQMPRLPPEPILQPEAVAPGAADHPSSAIAQVAPTVLTALTLMAATTVIPTMYCGDSDTATYFVCPGVCIAGRLVSNCPSVTACSWFCSCPCA